MSKLLFFIVFFLVYTKKYPNFALDFARVAKLVDAPDLGSGIARCVGSSPITRTIEENLKEFSSFLFFV